ncbi:hypothetical protein NMG60_11031333 [Bertholletia excelsa]
MSSRSSDWPESTWRTAYQSWRFWIFFSAARRTSETAIIWSVPSRRGSDSWAKMPNSLEPVKSFPCRSFSAIPRRRSASALSPVSSICFFFILSLCGIGLVPEVPEKTIALPFRRLKRRCELRIKKFTPPLVA